MRLHIPERKTSLFDMINVNSPEMDVDKTRKTILQTMVTEEHRNSSPVPTTVKQMNISFDDNCFHTYILQNSISISSNDLTDLSVALSVTSNSVLYYSDTTDVFSIQDNVDVSTDSDNENMPEISYQDELQSRYYYYESFNLQNAAVNRQIAECENQNETIRRFIGFDDLSEFTSDSDGDEQHIHFNSPVSSAPTFHATPMANSTMRTDNEDSIFTDASDFVPCLWSTEVNHSFQNSSADNSLINNGCLSPNLSSESEHCNAPTDLHDTLANKISLCCTHDSLHVIASSSFNRDEFSIDPQDAATNRNRTLPCANRCSDTNQNLSFYEPQQVETPNRSNSNRVPKQTFTILRALQAMKKATKSFGKKSKSIQKQLSETDHQTPQIEVNLRDKRTVAKKLHRFRESFRRKDTRQIKTLATL